MLREFGGGAERSVEKRMVIDNWFSFLFLGTAGDYKDLTASRVPAGGSRMRSLEAIVHEDQNASTTA